MRRVTALQTNFQAGEIDSLMRLRQDTTAWRNGVKSMRNVRPLLHGGARTRPPFQYVANAGASGRLLPFIFSNTQSYVIHLKSGSMTIYYDDGTVAVSSIVTPWVGGEIYNVRFAQSGDVMILVHQGYEPRILTRNGGASFALTTFAFDEISANVKSFPFYRYAASTVTLTPSSTSGSITITASAPIFAADWVNDYIRIDEKQIKITAYTSGTQVTGTVYQTLGGTSATTEWDEQAFSARRGWPGAVAFHGERLAFGGARSRKGGVWLSKIGTFYNFDIGTGLEDEGIWSGISGDRVNEVLHLVSHRHLLVLCDLGESYVPESDARPLTPENFGIKQQTPFGSAEDVRPLVFDESVMTAQRFGRAVRELLFADAAQAYSADPVSTLAPELARDIVDMDALTSSPDVSEQYLFAVLGDGTMSVLHSLRSQKITAWANWSTPNGVIGSVCVVNGKVYVLVNRWGGTFTLERIRFDLDWFALDCFIERPAGNAFTGLSHLNARVAGVVSERMYFGSGDVSGGELAIEEETDDVAYVGLEWSPRIETLPADVEDERGSTVGRPKRIVKASVGIHESVAFSVNGYSFQVRNVDDDLSQPPSPATGTYDFTLLGWRMDPTIVLTVDVPLSVTFLGVALTLAVKNED